MSSFPRQCNSAEIALNSTRHDLVEAVEYSGSGKISAESTAELAGRGNSTAFAEFTLALRPRLISFLHKRVGNIDDAEDIAQEAFAKAWLQIHRYNPKYKLSSWVYLIAKRVATDFHRRSLNTPTHSRTTIDLAIIADKDRHHDPDETASNIWATAHSVLTPDQYSALWLHYGEGLSMADVAHALSKSTVGIRVLLHRARKRMLVKLGTSKDE